MPEPNFIKLGIYFKVLEPISMAYIIDPPVSLCVCMYIPPEIALSKLVRSATIEELMYALISMPPLSCRKKVSD
jgi:hypothetical protein